MSRSIPWIASCPQDVKEKVERLRSQQLLLVKRVGPTSFLLSGRDGREKYRTSIGDPHHCSCGAAELCVHMLFVLCKVFFLPKENPLVWQRSLVAAEINELLEAETRVRVAQSRTAASEAGCAPRCLEDGDVCPICFEELDDTAPLSYCKGGCGKYVHTRCFKQYMRHNTGGLLRCPFCRSLWIDNGSNASRKCSGCKKYINGLCYRCLFCADYFSCSQCFHAGSNHLNHPFSLLGSTEIAERHISSGSTPSAQVVEATERAPPDVLPLMYRDLHPEDYETLLQLDERTRRRVLTPSEFMALRQEAWSASSVVDTCHICLEAFDTSIICVHLPCGHFFHIQCAQTWLTEHAAVCPVDHAAVTVPTPSEHPRGGSAILLPLARGQQRQSAPPQPLLPAPIERRRMAVGRVAPRPAARNRVVASRTPLPPLDIQVVPLGVRQRREQPQDRFVYGRVM